MKAIVWRGVKDIRLEDVPKPAIEDPYDVIVRLTASAICGTDLHFIRGTVTGMQPGTILGHEGVGIVEETGAQVRNFRSGDRVLVPSTICCGTCVYCRAGYTSQCDNANPNGPLAGTAFYGGPKETGPFNGMQAEFVRVPFGNVNLVKLPQDVDDDRAITLSDIFPTGYFGAKLAEVRAGDTVAVFGCGPVGQFAIASAGLLGAERIIAVDSVPDRLETARAQGAEVVDFGREDPVEILRELTGGTGPDRVIDAVGIDAEPGGREPEGEGERQAFEPGHAPSQVLEWAVAAVAKAGTIGIVGVYPPAAKTFPVGSAMEKNLTVKAGGCPHRALIPKLLDFVKTGRIRPERFVTKHEPLPSALEAFEAFDRRRPGWMKVELEPAPAAAKKGAAARPR